MKGAVLAATIAALEGVAVAFAGGLVLGAYCAISLQGQDAAVVAAVATNIAAATSGVVPTRAAVAFAINVVTASYDEGTQQQQKNPRERIRHETTVTTTGPIGGVIVMMKGRWPF